MTTLVNIKSSTGAIVNIYDYTILSTYTAIDLQRLPDDSIHGLQEEYEQERIEFEDYSIFKTYYDSIIPSSGGGSTDVSTLATSAKQDDMLALLSDHATETKQDLIVAELSKNYFPYYDVVTGAGTTPSDAYAFSVTNIGDAAGTLDGLVFPVDGHVEYTNVAAPMSYDATGTTYVITAHLTSSGG